MKEYLLLSTGRAGDIVYQFDTIDGCQGKAKEEILRGQQCSVFIKHSDLELPEVKVLKTERQQQAEEALTKITEEKIQALKP